MVKRKLNILNLRVNLMATNGQCTKKFKSVANDVEPNFKKSLKTIYSYEMKLENDFKTCKKYDPIIFNDSRGYLK